MLLLASGFLCGSHLGFLALRSPLHALRLELLDHSNNLRPQPVAGDGLREILHVVGT